jgi:hypothetical protein
MVLGGVALFACDSPSDTAYLSVTELMDNPVYDQEISVFGTVYLLNEVNSTSFELRSEGNSIKVWYDMMVEDDETACPGVDVDNIKNGDTVLVSGELKTDGTYRMENDFWLSEIVIITEEE